MGRTLSGTMSSILGASDHDLDYTLDLTFPDATYFKFATSPLTIPVLGDYTNDLESVREIRLSLTSAADKVGVSLQNQDRVLGLHLATYWQKWRKAEAIIGRFYRDQVGLGLSEWKEMFRGAVQQPNANDFQVSFDIIHDTLSPGEIICIKTLALPCPSVYKDPKTCAYAGGLTTCDHNLKSTGGCDGHANSEHYGGMEHRFSPASSVPGTGGNTGGSGGGTGGGGTGGGGFGGCPRLDQYVWVKGENGCRVAKMVCFFTEQDLLWNPKTRRFHKTKHAEILKDQPIWEMVAANGAVSFSSFSHRRLWYFEHGNGEPVKNFVAGDPTLTLVGNDLENSKALLSRDTGELGDVMKIEMDPEGHGDDQGRIFCTGDSPDKMFCDHNLKPLLDD